MTTLNQRQKVVIKKNTHSLSPALLQCPQVRGRVVRLKIVTPRKPNSAIRKVARVLLSSYKRVDAYIPGIGHKLQKHSTVLVRGGRVKDLPGMKYTIIRGKFDLKRLDARRKACSKYGAKLVRKRFDHRYRKLTF